MAIRIDGTNTTANPGVTGGDADTGLVFGTDEVSIVTGGTDRVTVGSTGNLSIAAGNLVLASGSGIDFSATADSSGTMTSELLDDYEEGTWTPTVIGTVSAGTVNYTQRIGDYTKVGNMVTVLLEVGWNSGTGSGNLKITGLPFATTRNVVEALGASSNLTYTSGQTPYIYTSSSSNVSIGVSAASSVAAALAYDSAATIYVTFSYFV